MPSSQLAHEASVFRTPTLLPRSRSAGTIGVKARMTPPCPSERYFRTTASQQPQKLQEKLAVSAFKARAAWFSECHSQAPVSAGWRIVCQEDRLEFYASTISSAPGPADPQCVVAYAGLANMELDQARNLLRLRLKPDCFTAAQCFSDEGLASAADRSRTLIVALESRGDLQVVQRDVWPIFMKFLLFAHPQRAAGFARVSPGPSLVWTH